MNMYAYVGGDPINLSDPTGTETLCVTHTTTRIPKCVKVGNKDGSDLGLSPAQEDQLESSFGDFIMGHGGIGNSGPNLSGFGKSVVGPASAAAKAMVSAVSQFVGYVAAHATSEKNNKNANAFREQWDQVQFIEARNDFSSKRKEGVSLMLGGTPAGIGYWVIFSGSFGYGDSRSIYQYPSDIARALFHEPWHIKYPDNPGRYRAAQHEAIDNWARLATGMAGFGRCQAVGGFRKC